MTYVKNLCISDICLSEKQAFQPSRLRTLFNALHFIYWIETILWCHFPFNFTHIWKKMQFNKMDLNFLHFKHLCKINRFRTELITMKCSTTTVDGCFKHHFLFFFVFIISFLSFCVTRLNALTETRQNFHVKKKERNKTNKQTTEILICEKFVKWLNV